MPANHSAPCYNANTEGSDTPLLIRVRVETWRMIAYVFFWTFVVVAKMVTKARVVDILAAGVDDSVPLEQRGCGPFDREGGPFNLTYGEGFDYKTENHLIEFFGFGNICTNWDYTPAREITAMVFPLFEYSMMIYLALNAINEKLAHNRGEISDSFYRSTQIFNPIIAFLCTMFRE